jgi:hypothetical protein
MIDLAILYPINHNNDKVAIRLADAFNKLKIMTEVFYIDVKEPNLEPILNIPFVYSLLPEEWIISILDSLYIDLNNFINIEYYRKRLDKALVKELFTQLAIPVPMSAERSPNKIIIKSKKHLSENFIVNSFNQMMEKQYLLDTDLFYAEEYIENSYHFKVYYFSSSIDFSQPVSDQVKSLCYKIAKKIEITLLIEVFSMDVLISNENGFLYFVDLNAAPAFSGLIDIDAFLENGMHPIMKFVLD